MKKTVRSAFLAAIVVFSFALPAPASGFVFPLYNEDGFPHDGPPAVSASSWIIYDELTDSVLAEWDADTRRPMASITKIMTVLLALENGNLGDEVVVSETAAGEGGQRIGLVEGETLTLGALVRAAMLRSGNDSATAIAEHIAGSVDGFVAMMNSRAEELGMTNTNFVNPSGLDAPGHFSSARDMLILGRYAMSIPEFEDLARSRMLVFPDTPGGSPRSAENTNRILNSYHGVIGVKTGETPNAALTYVGVTERSGRRLFVVVLRSVGQRGHFADATALFDWGYKELGINGTLYAGIPYQPMADRVEDSPLLVEAQVESHLHTAAQGLTADPPSPPGVGEVSDLPAVVEITRHANPAPTSVWDTFLYWLVLMAGGPGG